MARDPFHQVALLLEQELLLLLSFSIRLQLVGNALFDQLEQNGRHVHHLLMYDVNALHLQVGVGLVCLVILQLLHFLLASL